MKKKKWKKPKLSVLIRGTPEERILSQCKAGAGWSSGPGAGNTGCDNTGVCGSCSWQTSS
ncbi:MAG: hypothetical protein WC695_00750 [Candidatus Omnitrophota bacterium]